MSKFRRNIPEYSEIAWRALKARNGYALTKEEKRMLLLEHAK